MKRYIYLRAEFLPEDSSDTQIQVAVSALKASRIPVYLEGVSTAKKAFLESKGFIFLSYLSVPTYNWAKAVIVNRDVSWWASPPKYPNANYLIQTADGDIFFRGLGYKTVQGTAADIRYSSLRIGSGIFRAPILIEDDVPQIDFNGDKTGLFHLYLSPNDSLWRAYAGTLCVSSTAPVLSGTNYVLSIGPSLGALYLGTVLLYQETTHDEQDKKFIFDKVTSRTSRNVVIPANRGNVYFENAALVYQDVPVVFSFPVNNVHHPRCTNFSPGIFNIFYIQGEIFQTGYSSQLFLFALEPSNTYEATITWNQLRTDVDIDEYLGKDIRGAVLIGVCNARFGSLLSEEDIFPIVTEIIEGEGLKIEITGPFVLSG